MLANRPWAYLLLLASGLFLFLPNLGKHSFWEEDEAHNAACASEMAEAGTWVVPTFNFKLRPDKPILQYWCLRGSYLLFGENEWAARLPSMLASLLSLLLTYELGRALFDAKTGLVAGLLLGSSVLFCVASHAVTPDAFLILTTLAAFTAFAVDYRAERSGWLVLSPSACAFAVLAKGPVGLVLPVCIVGLFLLLQRQWGLVCRRTLILGGGLFAAIAVPWYILVGLETRFEFVRGFLLRHNLSRFQQPMEGHSGGPWFHALALFVTFAPASVFLIAAIVAAWHGEWANPREPRSWWRRVSQPLLTGDWAYRLLTCWCLVWLIFFSLAATKLPNYMLPIFPALAVLVARFLVRWLGGNLVLSALLSRAALVTFALVGPIIGTGLLVASGVVPGIDLRGREIPQLLPLACMAAVTVLSAILAWHWLPTRPQWTLATLLAGSISLVGTLAALGPAAIEDARAVKVLAQAMNAHMPPGDVLIGCHQCYHPSLVFYSRRQVARSLSDERALDFLASPWPTFLIVTEQNWSRLRALAPADCQVLAGAVEFRHGGRLLLVRNTGHSSVEYPTPIASPPYTPLANGPTISLGVAEHGRPDGSAFAFQ